MRKDDTTPGPTADAPPASRAEPLPDPHPGQKSRLRRWVRRLSLLTAVTAASLAGLYLTRESTLHPLLTRVVPPAARWLANVDLALTDIDGNWRNTLTLKGLALEPRTTTAASPLRRFTAESLQLDGPLMQLTRGASGLAELTSIRAVRPSITLDLTQDSPESTTQTPPTIPALPSITIEYGSAELLVENDTIRIDDIAASGRLSADTPLTVEASASGRNWNLDLTGTATRTSPSALAFRADAPTGSARGVAMEATNIQGAWSPEETRIESGRVAVGANQIEAQGLVFRSGPAGIEAGGKLELNLPDLSDAHHVACALRGVEDRGGWSGTATGTIDLTPTPGQISAGTIELRGKDLVLRSVDIGTFTLSATGDETGLSISEALATDGAGSQVRGSGKLAFAEGTPALEALEGATLEGVTLTAQLDRPEELTPVLKGIEGLLADVKLSGALDAPDGTVTLRADAFEVNDVAFEGLKADGTLTSGRIAFDESTITTPYGTATATANVGLPLAGRPLDARITSFRWVEEGAELTLVEPVPIEISDEGIRIEELRLASGDGEARATFASVTDEGWSLDLEITDLQLEPFLAHVEAAKDVHFGALRGTAKAATSGEKDAVPRAEIDLTLERSADATAAPVAARVKATWVDEVVTFEDVVIELEAAQLQLAGSAPLGVGESALLAGEVNLQGRLGVDAEALMNEPARSLLGADVRRHLERASGRAFATAALTGSWDALRGTMEVQLEDARYAPEPGEEPLLEDALSGRLALRLGESITLEPSGLELGSTASISLEGSLAQSLSLTEMAADPAARLDAWKTSALEVDADMDFASLDWLARFLPELRATDGKLTGSAQIRGTAADMQRSGRLVLSGGGARYRGLPPLENAEVTVRLDPELITIENADLEVGAAPVSLGGTVLLGDGQPRFDLTINGTEVLLVRSADARLRGDLDLELTGRADALRVEGDVKIVSGRLRSPIEFQSLLSGSSNTPQAVRRGVRIPSFGPESLALNIALRTEDPVSLRGRIARGSIRADLRLIGTADHPTPIGEVFFDPLELAVPAGTIEFPTGLIRFSPDAPDIPQIDLVGATRLAGYDVTVNVEGAYDEPDVQLSSSPPLAPEDLLLLVLSGQPPSQGGGIEAAGQSVALYVAKDLVRGWFSSGGFEDEDKESFLDRLQVTTGRDVSRSGTLTVEATYKLREGFARDRDALYVVLERDSYEDYGLGLRLVLRLR